MATPLRRCIDRWLGWLPSPLVAADDDAAGVAYQALDNGLASVEDPSLARGLAARLSLPRWRPS
jgi:hypothetical protein